jgi:pyruvate formate lyase activating enzyme
MNLKPRKNKKDPDSGLVFDIQKFSLHDGQGIRTLIFLKGCPLRCNWCSNPEGQSSFPELAYNREKCIGISGCGRCLPICKEKAVMGEDEKIHIDRSLCRHCGECLDTCPSEALTLFGETMDVDEVIKIVEEDSVFYTRSGGGLTLGGGEPLSQGDFAARVIEAAKGRGLDTAMETSGYGDWKILKSICSRVNQIFFDIKSMDLHKHKRYTGVSNKLILEKFAKMCHAFPKLPIMVRTPVIPGFNDSTEDITAIVNFLNQQARPIGYELLPYHGFGQSKYQHLGKRYPGAELKPPDETKMVSLKKAAAQKFSA